MLIDFIKPFWTLVLVAGTYLDLDGHRLLNSEISQSSSKIKIYENIEDAEKIAKESLKIASEICVYTNGNMVVESIIE